MSNSIVAIEIGSSKIKVAIGELEPSDALLIKNIKEIHQDPNTVSYGLVQNVRVVANELKNVITSLESSLTNSKISGVYVAVGGRSLTSTPAQIEENLSGVTEVTPEIVERMMKRAQTTSPDHTLLEVLPTEYRIDGKAHGINPIGILGTEMQAHVNLVTIRTQLMRNLEMTIQEKLGLDINGFVVRPLAVSNLVMSDEERGLGAMLVDFGAETTTVSIYKKGTLQYLATIPLGSRHITRDLTALHYTEERAEEIKKTSGNAYPGKTTAEDSFSQVDTTDINNYIGMRAGEIAANINAQIGFAGMTVQDLPCGIILVGGGANLRGFVELLGQETKLPVRRGTTPSTVRVLGTKLDPMNDLDIVAIMKALPADKIKECVTKKQEEITKPEPPEERPKEQDVPQEQDDVPEDTFEDDEYPKKKSFFKRVVNGIQNMISPIEDEEDEEFS